MGAGGGASGAEPLSPLFSRFPVFSPRFSPPVPARSEGAAGDPPLSEQHRSAAAPPALRARGNGTAPERDTPQPPQRDHPPTDGSPPTHIQRGTPRPKMRSQREIWGPQNETLSPLPQRNTPKMGPHIKVGTPPRPVKMEHPQLDLSKNNIALPPKNGTYHKVGSSPKMNTPSK